MKTVEIMTIECLYREALKKHGACLPPFDERAYAHTSLKESIEEFKELSINLYKELQNERESKSMLISGIELLINKAKENGR